MIDPDHLLRYVIRPTLSELADYNPAMRSKAAEELMIGTAIQESQLRYLRQLGGGPALGLWQVEPDTEMDCWENFIKSRDVLNGIMGGIINDAPDPLATNLAYNCAIARIKYWRAPDALPEAGDLEGQANYWKKFYNTEDGKGTRAEYIANYRLIIK